MRSIGILLLIVVLIQPSFAAESGSVCIAPVRYDPKVGSGGAPWLPCGAEKVSFRVDAQAVPSPIKESLTLTGLDLDARHRVIALCDHKPQQSFTFRFSEYKARELCLFLNDLYLTVQLSEAKRAPWCQCRISK